MTYGARNGGSFSVMIGPMHIKLTTVDIWVVNFTYTLTQILVCIFVYIDCILYSKYCVQRPLKKCFTVLTTVLWVLLVD